MRKSLVFVFLVALVVIAGLTATAVQACEPEPTVTPTSTPTVEPTVTPEPTHTPTSTPTVEPTVTPEPTHTPTSTPEPPQQPSQPDDRRCQIEGKHGVDFDHPWCVEDEVVSEPTPTTAPIIVPPAPRGGRPDVERELYVM